VKMSKKRYSNDFLNKILKKIYLDVNKAKWVILGIILFYFLLMQVTYSTCPLIMTTGIPCPFCGMTRAGIALLKGEFFLAFKLNPCIYGVLFLVIAFFVVRYFMDKSISVLKPMFIGFILITIAVYLYRMYDMFPDQWPMLYYKENLWSKWGLFRR